MGQVRIGTCSWTDPTLVACGRFYPAPARSPADRLRFYAEHFPTVEVDSSFYALPSRRNSQLWVERTPPGFTFHIKAFGLFTQHAVALRSLPRDVREALPETARGKQRIYPRDMPDELMVELWSRFAEAIAPLADGSKLEVVLFQFPPWFNPGSASKEHLLLCQERLPGHNLGVEFRNRLWLDESHETDTLKFLTEHHFTFVSVDEPQGFKSSVPPIAAASTDIAYVRFHGRNQETWEKSGGSASGRYNHYYTGEELEEWVPRIHKLQQKTRAVYLMMNTNYTDQGIVNARALAAALGEPLGQAITKMFG